MAVKVDFNEQVNFMDPDYGTVFLTVGGKVEIGHNSFDEETLNSIAQKSINLSVMSAMQKRFGKCSYRELASQVSGINEDIASMLTKNGFIVSSVNVTSIAPTPDALEFIEKLDRSRMVASMSPEELAKKQQEAMEQAMKTVASAQAVNPAPVPNYPKFCPECGTPTTGSNFCPNCGNRLRF